MFARIIDRFGRAAGSAAALGLALALVTGCGHGGNSGAAQTDAQSQPAAAAPTVAAQADAAATPDAGTMAAAAPATAATDAAAAATDAPAATVAATGPPAATTAPDTASGQTTGTPCPLISADQVAEVMHLKVDTVKVHSDPVSCDFSFAGTVENILSVEYDPHGGPDEIKSVRIGNGGAQAIIGGIINAATGNNSSQNQGMKNFVAATPPPDVAHVGDDQYFLTVGPMTKFIAVKGDAYVDVSGVVMADGLSRWQVLPELARRVLASR